MRGQRGRAAGPKELARRRVTRARPAWRRDGPQAKVIAFFQCLAPRLGRDKAVPPVGWAGVAQQRSPQNFPTQRPGQTGQATDLGFARLSCSIVSVRGHLAWPPQGTPSVRLEAWPG